MKGQEQKERGQPERITDEIGYFKYSLEHAQNLVEFAGLTYNFIFEYAFAYSLSYIILVGLKVIKSTNHKKQI